MPNSMMSDPAWGRASMIAWLVARDLLGHSRPFFAPIAVVICIGVGLGQRLRRVFELHGFANVETRAEEPLDVLLRKGEIDKEVYALKRLAAADSEPAELAPELHRKFVGAV